MATVITRRAASTPQRSPAETWDVIMAIVAPDKSSAGRAELEKVAGVAAATISSEAPNEDGFVIYGTGPQIRVYCVFGDDAITGGGVNESALRDDPTDGDWRMSIPCLKEDLEWMQKKLESLSTRVTARAVGESVEYEKIKTQQSSGLVVDLKEFFKS